MSKNLVGRFADVPIFLHVEVDRIPTPLIDVLCIKEGSVVTLSKPAGEPLDIYAGEVLIGEGEVTVINSSLGIRVTAHTNRRKLYRNRRYERTGFPALKMPDSTPDGLRDSSIFQRLLNKEVTLSVVIGGVWLPLDSAISLGAGSIIELETTREDPVDVVVNGHVCARGQVVVVDGRYGARIDAVIRTSLDDFQDEMIFAHPEIEYPAVQAAEVEHQRKACKTQ